jgi:hypothetical protein
LWLWKKQTNHSFHNKNYIYVPIKNWGINGRSPLPITLVYSFIHLPRRSDFNVNFLLKITAINYFSIHFHLNKWLSIYICFFIFCFLSLSPSCECSFRLMNLIMIVILLSGTEPLMGWTWPWPAPVFFLLFFILLCYIYIYL